jgi:hypothetical protein
MQLIAKVLIRGFGLAIIILALFFPIAPAQSATQINDEALASYWAPIVYQDTDSTDYSADYITNFDFDGDWNGCNNWENKDNYPLKAWVYYWVVETPTNWFIGYAFFHPRDWAEINTDLVSHENDMEGCLLVIKKGGSIYGKFLVMITQAHWDFYSFKDFEQFPSDGVKQGYETIDGDVDFLNSHPKLYIQAKGHGIIGDEQKTLPDDTQGTWRFNPYGDYVIYYPDRIAQEPRRGNDRHVSYGLKNMNEIWNKRYNPETFYNYGTFRGDTYGKSKANAPWGWDDWNDGEIARGELYEDPAHLVDYYHEGLGEFSHDYIYRSYPYL